jgi:hypothetical protein
MRGTKENANVYLLFYCFIASLQSTLTPSSAHEGRGE